MENNKDLIQIVDCITSELRQLEADILLMQMQIQDSEFNMQNQTRDSIINLVNDYNDHLQKMKFFEGKYQAFQTIINKITEIKND